MGSFYSRRLEDNERELKNITNNLLELLHELGPAELLNRAVKDSKIYEVCKNNEELRQACLVDAFRRYYEQKFLYEEVYNRTVDYMRLFDDFLKVQNAVDEQRQLEEASSEETSSVRRRNKLESDKN
ncbi:uncharacterized protein LOC123006655 [Tribolium madens]|uniref:uncharacterized protein LOC123006655 n=1 Tax=Tribolium madens TaxID=41895 RepID=UPI001CF74AA0|nr:uncharacterized protein LOC123006655 [Tribolium madens]